MKLKYYLRGLGIGIIMTTMILSFTKKEITDQEIIDRAMELGMVKKEDPKGNLDDVYAQLGKDKNSNKDSAVDNGSDANVEQKAEGEDISSDDSTSSDQESTTSDDADEKDISKDLDNEDTSSSGEEQVVIQEQESKEVEELIAFHIPEGKSSLQVSYILEDVGIISDVQGFNEYVKSQGKTKQIRTGNFTLAPNTPYEKILNVITREEE